MSTEKKLPTKGMHEVQFVDKFGSYKKNDKAIYHASTASTLAKKGIVKILKEIKEHIPKTMKQ